MKHLSKRDKVLNHLKSEGSITSWEAITNYQATRLSAIIFDLKKEGYSFRTVLLTQNGANYAKYYLTNFQQELV